MLRRLGGLTMKEMSKRPSQERKSSAHKELLAELELYGSKLNNEEQKRKS